jgi:predicted nucleotidyltransferase component of viral defense system
LPRTFAPASDDASRARVVEPALLHYTHAYRAAEPALADRSVATRWHDAQRRVMDRLLRAIAASPWREHLVLRGSALMKAWVGEAARNPGDLDFTVTPHAKLISEPWATGLFAGMMRLIAPDDRFEKDVEILVDHVATDDIWTYDRAPGKRVVYPWRAEGLPSGAVQIDVVFGEQITPPPTRTLIPAVNGVGGSELLAASREQSLAWKILWLETDAYPQGKDLYDAVLLGERISTLSRQLVLDTLRTSPDYRPSDVPLEDLTLRWQVDWDNFKLEHPDVPGDAGAWKSRLQRALRRALDVQAQAS